MSKRVLTRESERSNIGDVRGETAASRPEKHKILGLKKTSKKVKKGVDKREDVGYTTKAVAENGQQAP